MNEEFVRDNISAALDLAVSTSSRNSTGDAISKFQNKFGCSEYFSLDEVLNYIISNNMVICNIK